PVRGHRCSVEEPSSSTLITTITINSLEVVLYALYLRYV
nr:hypothetical protein [Tanacetum cinerariifolium]